jgi:hypothetical protein
MVITRISCVVNSMQRYPRAKMMFVHLERLATLGGAAQKGQPQEGSSVVVNRNES